MKVIDIKRSKKNRRELIITVATGWWLWKHEIIFFGSGTIWYDKRTGKRTNVITESYLTDVAEQWKWQQKSEKERRVLLETDMPLTDVDERRYNKIRLK